MRSPDSRASTTPIKRRLWESTALHDAEELLLVDFTITIAVSNGEDSFDLLFCEKNSGALKASLHLLERNSSIVIGIEPAEGSFDFCSIAETVPELGYPLSCGGNHDLGELAEIDLAIVVLVAEDKESINFLFCELHAFVRFDTNKDGQISRSEVVQGMRSSGMQFTEEEIDTLFILGDKDNNGEIDFSEFAQIMIPTATERITKLRNCFRNRAEVEAAFSRFDANHDGAISFQEMKAGLQSSGILFTEQEVETVFAVADRDGDGEVSLTEFVHILSTSSHESGVNGVVGKFWKYCVDVAFKQIDTNRDGAICLQELKHRRSTSSIPFSDQEIQTIFALADHDRDGEVSLNELVKVLGK
jgi:Ca2+-binding EF-hand superfamily protein